MSSEHTEELQDLLFSLQKSIRYYQRRRAFLESSQRGTMFFIIIFGTATFGDLFGDPRISGALTVLVATLDLVWNPGAKARDHVILHHRVLFLLNEIYAELKKSDSQIDHSAIVEWNNKRREIEVDEPPILWAVEAAAYNDVLYAHPDWTDDFKQRSRRSLQWYHQVLKQIWPFSDMDV